MCATDAIGVEDGDTKLTNRLRGKPDPARNTAKERQRRRLPQSLIVDCSCELFLPDSSDDFAQGVVRASFRLPDLRCQSATVDQRLPARMGHPNDFSFRKRLAQASDSGKGVDNISEGTKTHNQEALFRHAAPCEWTPEVLAWNDPWRHQRWPRGCRAERQQRAPARSRRCSRCLWRGHPGAALSQDLLRWVRPRAPRNPRSATRPLFVRGHFHQV